MTAITLNLLAEEQLAEQANARDPFKTTLAICISVLMFVAMSGSALLMVASQKKTEADMLQTRWDSIAAAQAGGVAADFQSAKSFADDIVAINHARPLYAHQLALIKDLLPDSIQLSRITFATTTQVRDAGNAGPKAVSHLTLQLQGKATSNRPELEVDAYIQTLRGNAAFGEWVREIQLRSIARPSGSGGEVPSGPLSADFLIECQYKELN